MLSTKNINIGSGSSVVKTFVPGNVKAKINSVNLEDYKFKEGAKHIILHIEGEDMGEGFEGFYIDKDNPELGRYKGQIGRVRVSEYAYATEETRFGVSDRDAEILKAIKSMCMALNITAWFDAQDEKHETIEEFVEAFNSEAPFKDKWLDICLCGREYVNDAGYTNYDLYLPKFRKGLVPYEIAGTKDSKLIKFDPAQHIKKKEAKAVEHFGDDPTPAPAPAKKKSVAKDFEL